MLLLLLVTMLGACREDDVTDTHKWINEVNAKAPTAQHKTINLTGVTSLNGSISGYYIDGELVKGTLNTYEESGRKTENYYFKSGELVCVQKQEYIYNKPQYMDEAAALKNGDSTWYDDKKTIVLTNMFYFYDKRLVKWINEKKKLVPETDRAYQYTTTTLLNDADKLQKMFRE